MDYSNLIKALQNQVCVGHFDAHTEDLLKMALAAISAKDSPQEQHAQLLTLKDAVSKLAIPSMPNFLGGSAKLL